MRPGDFVAALVAGAEAPSIGSIDALRAHLASHASADATADTIERAALGGRDAAGLGWAFACGYEAAITKLAATQDPQRSTAGAGALVALCASERGGPHHRAIQTTLAPRAGGGWEMSGQKTFVTLGEHADRLVVIATTGLDAGGRPRLRAAWVPARREGVALSAAQGAATLAFAPEISHARVTFDAVRVGDDELSPGDGYDDVSKPFRTIEDAHVLAAAVGYGVGVARRSGWDAAWVERAVAALMALRALAASPPASAGTHLALAGALSWARDLLDAGDWPKAPEAVRTAWQRDRALLEVAGAARAARLAAAWRSLGR
jgi:acyl-CoA dehydrogenase